MIQDPRARRYYEKHRDEILARKRERYQANLATGRERSRVQTARSITPERQRAANSRKKAKAGGAIGSHSVKEWNRLVARYRGECAYCGAVANLTREHVIPVSRGGSDFIGNILPACTSCNCSKQDKLPMEWSLWKRRSLA